MKAGPLEQYLRTWNIIPRKDDPSPTRLHQFLLSNRVSKVDLAMCPSEWFTS